MGGKVTNMIIPVAVGIAAGVAFPAAPAIAGGATTFGWTAAAAGAGLTSMLMAPDPPTLPDFGPMMQNQQAALTQDQSFGRRSGAELEDMLENGSERDKNSAFSELQRRGEDETRLNEIATRKTRTAQDQDRIDTFIAENAPPTASETELLAQELAANRLGSFESDVEAENTRIKQISAQRGTLDSSRNDAMNLGLAGVAAKNRGDIRNAARDSALQFQTGVAGLQNTGLNRLFQGANVADTNSQFNIGLANSERAFQEQLRGAKTADQRNLAFQNFQASVDNQLAGFQAKSADARSRGLQSAGLLGLGLNSALGGKTSTVLSPSIESGVANLTGNPIPAAATK